MARAINHALLLSVYQNLMDNDSERIAFVGYIAANNPRLMLKFSGREDFENQRIQAWEKDKEDLRSALASKCELEMNIAEVRRTLYDVRRELDAYKNPVRTPDSDATKEIFERMALDQDRTFGTIPDAKVKVSFDLRDRNKKINTIKWFREQSGYGLAEAKGWSEGVKEYDYRCTYARAVEIRNKFREFAMRDGYTGVIYIKGE
jgi:ribosomal protein L7/L12